MLSLVDVEEGTAVRLRVLAGETPLVVHGTVLRRQPIDEQERTIWQAKLVITAPSGVLAALLPASRAEDPA